MIRRPPRSTRVRLSAASDVYKRQSPTSSLKSAARAEGFDLIVTRCVTGLALSLIHISEPTRLLSISYAVFCLKKKKSKPQKRKEKKKTKNKHKRIKKKSQKK